MSKLNQISNRNTIHGSDIDFNSEKRSCDDINRRINTRIIPDSILQPNFDPRPVSTKYSIFPIIDRVKEPTVDKEKYEKYNLSGNFNPGNDRAPVNGFLENVNIESELRGNLYKLTGGDLGHKFIPARHGPLYKHNVGNPMEIPDSKHHLLFKNETYIQQRSLDDRIGKDTFHNNTRVQLRDL